MDPQTNKILYLFSKLTFPLKNVYIVFMRKLYFYSLETKYKRLTDKHCLFKISTTTRKTSKQKEQTKTKISFVKNRYCRSSLSIALQINLKIHSPSHGCSVTIAQLLRSHPQKKIVPIINKKKIHVTKKRTLLSNQACTNKIKPTSPKIHYLKTKKNWHASKKTLHALTLSVQQPHARLIPAIHLPLFRWKKSSSWGGSSRNEVLCPPPATSAALRCQGKRPVIWTAERIEGARETSMHASGG